MMRLLIPIASLVVALAAIAVDWVAPAPESRVCRLLGCRDDQLATVMEQHGVTPEGLASLVEQDASNPHIWATYGEYLANAGDVERAERAFGIARMLGPNLSPVLMRAANFAFGHQRAGQGLELTPVILAQTDEFDDILFSYIARAGLPASDVVGTAVPATARAGRAWARWVNTNGTDADVLATWEWLQRERLADEPTALAFVNTLWQRRALAEAEKVWRTLAANADARVPNQRLWNTRFEREPLASPFDWDLSPRAGLQYARKDGLIVQFKGDTNVGDIGVRQAAVVSPGAYRLRARVRADGISTDEGVFFIITDAEDPSRFRASTAPVIGTLPEHDLVLDLNVPDGTRALDIRLSRTPSLKFDHDLGGTLAIRSVELLAVER